MMIEPADLEKLKKLLVQTTSSNDGEALNAIRAANRLITRLGTDWESLLAGKVVSAVEPYVSDEDKELIRAFNVLADKPPSPGTFADTLASIEAQWEEKGTLSARQREVVLDAARRAR